jgi:hypothetical protein
MRAHAGKSEASILRQTRQERRARLVVGLGRLGPLLALRACVCGSMAFWVQAGGFGAPGLGTRRSGRLWLDDVLVRAEAFGAFWSPGTR